MNVAMSRPLAEALCVVGVCCLGGLLPIVTIGLLVPWPWDFAIGVPFWIAWGLLVPWSVHKELTSEVGAS